MNRTSLKRLATTLALVWSTLAIAQGGSYDTFFTAILRDNPSPLQRLAPLGFDFNTPSPELQPPLVLAIQRESWRVADFLLTRPELDLEARNPADENALMLAAIKGQTELVQRLIERGAQVNKPGWTPLHYAASHKGPQALTITRLLLERHAYIDAASPNGSTPLMLAAQYGREDVVRVLLEEGADPALRNQLGLNAIDFAFRADRPDIAEAVAAALRQRQPRGSW